MKVHATSIRCLLDQTPDHRKYRFAKLDIQIDSEHGVIVNGSNETMVHVNGEHIPVWYVLIVRGNVDGVQTSGNAAFA